MRAMDTQFIMKLGLIAAALLAAWFAFKIIKKIVFAALVMLVILGVAAFVYAYVLQ
jgi:hypothetical protein